MTVTVTIKNRLTVVHTDTNAVTVSSALSQTLPVAYQTMSTGNEDNPFKPTDTDRDGVPDAIEVNQGSNPLVKDNDVFTSDTRFIQQIYRDLLRREADAGGLDFWRSQLTSGVINRTDLIAAYLDSPEFQSQEGAIARLYHAAFGRMPDATGFAYWVQQLQQGASLETISASFLGSPEWANLAIVSDAAFVDHLYNTVLHRDPDAADQTFWEGQLAHGVSRVSVLLSFTESLENQAALASKVAVDLLYLGLLDREGDIWNYNYWVSVLESGTQTKDQVIDAFLKSQEFHDRVLQASVMIDTIAPTVTVAPATIQNSGYAVVQSTETGTAYLVNDAVTVASVDDITSAADDRWNQVDISSASTDTPLAAMDLADGVYHVYAVDAAGNLSLTSSDSVTIDGAPPTTTVIPVTIQNSGYAVVQSTETGTAYLVKDTVTVTGLSDITRAADNTWNQMTVTSANTNTDLAATGLADGTYRVYAVDAAGNLSSPSINRVTLDSTPPTATVAPATMQNSSNAVVQSTEIGTVYLVRDSVTVNSVNDITRAADNTWNAVTISSTHTDTNLEATDLVDGTYHVYAVDAAGNLSAASTNSVIINTTSSGGGGGSLSNTIVGHVIGGPVVAGNDLKATIYAADGATLLGEGVINADGSVTVQVSAYTGVVVVHVASTGGQADYFDEATGQPKDLGNAVLSSAGTITTQGMTLTLNINVLTTVAYKKAVEAAGANPLDATLVSQTNTAVAQAFGLTDLTGDSIQTIIDSGGNSQSANTYGRILAALSGADQSHSGNTQATIDALASGTTVVGTTATLDTTTLQALIDGANTVDPDQIGGLVNAVSNATEQSSNSVAIDTVAGDNIINASERYTTITGINASGATVTLSIGSNNRTATVNGAGWSYILTDADISAMGQGGEALVANATLNSTTAQASRGIYVDTMAPTATVTMATIQNTGNAVVQSSETGTAYLVKDSVTVTGVSDITGAANDHWNQVTIASANTNTNLAAAGLADGVYHVYAVDAAGNLSAVSTNSVTITNASGDTTPPTATVTTATIQNTGNAVVQSSETGTAYLVKDSVTVTGVSDITGAADDAWNSVTISSANTNTNLAAAGLADGVYHVYAVDAAGNLSVVSANSVTITSASGDTTPPTATVTHAIIPDYCHAVVQSSETGTAYLVNDSVSVSSVSDITGAADNNWNSVAITSANTDTDLTATGLAAGTYHVYTEDAAGNLSAQSGNSVTVTFTNNTITPDQSVVIFDIGSGRSSCHSDRIFDADTNYTIYIIFPNEDGEGGLGTLAEDNKWSGAENLGSNDMVILVGSSTYGLGASGYSYRFNDQIGNATKSKITIRQTTHTLGYITTAQTSAWITLHNNGKLTYNSKYSGTVYVFQTPPDLWEGAMGNMTHPGDHYLLDINTSQGNDTAKMPYGLITSQLGLG